MARFSLLLIILFFSCNAIDIEEEKKHIEAQIDLITKAHYEKDAELFYKPYAQSWVDLRNGTIHSINKQDQIKSTQAYLEAMEFQQLEFLAEPVMELSDDATMATYANSILVKGLLDKNPTFWVVSWQNTLQKIDGEWKIISAANTEADEQLSASAILDQARNFIGDVDSVNTIYALADCKDPEENLFRTLIMSSKDNGRMEQKNGDRHTILKHGKTSWGYNVNSKTAYDSLNAGLQFFVKSHELHWLSMWPETRYKNPSFEGIIDFKEQKTFKIRFKDDMGRPVNFYYAFNNYAPLAFDIEIDDKGSIVTTYFEEWDKLDAISVFRKATFEEGSSLFKYDFVDLRINSLKDADFDNSNNLIND